MANDYVRAIVMTSINANTFDGTYKVINAAGLDEACSIIRIINTSDKALIISYDGVTDHEYLPAVSTLQLPFQSNSSPTHYKNQLEKGVKVFVKAAVGTGLVYLSGYYC